MPNLIDRISFRNNEQGTTTTYLISNSVLGYYNSTDGKFYKESTFTTAISGVITLVYIDISTNYIYRYDELNTEFIQIGGSGEASDAIVYVNSLPSSNIKDVIYGMVTRTSYTETIADEFLDNNDLFEKTPGSGADYTYTAADGAELEASIDGISYKSFVSLAYDGTSDWTLTYADASTATLANGDSFYFKSVSRVYYAGNETEQSVTPFASGGGGGGGATYLPGTGIDITNNIISIEPATNAIIGGVKPDNSTIVVDVNGTISGNYQAGHGITITGNEISDKTFIGTEAEWNALTPAQQAEYDMVSISDDGAPVDLTPGHTIQDETTTFPQRSNLQFEDMTVTDDSTNGITKVAPIPYTAGDKIDITNNEVSCDETVKGTFIGTKTEWEALNTTDKAKYDIVNLTDDAASPSVVVDTVADGNMNAVTSNAVYNNSLKKSDTTFTTSITGWCQKFITKIDNIVIFNICNPAAYSFTAGWNTLDFTFPEGYRPKLDAGASATYVRYPCQIQRVGTMGSFEINTDGSCRVYASTATSSECLFVSGMFRV